MRQRHADLPVAESFAQDLLDGAEPGAFGLVPGLLDGGNAHRVDEVRGVQSSLRDIVGQVSFDRAFREVAGVGYLFHVLLFFEEFQADALGIVLLLGCASARPLRAGGTKLDARGEIVGFAIGFDHLPEEAAVTGQLDVAKPGNSPDLIEVFRQVGGQFHQGGVGEHLVSGHVFFGGHELAHGLEFTQQVGLVGQLRFHREALPGFRHHHVLLAVEHGAAAVGEFQHRVLPIGFFEVALVKQFPYQRGPFLLGVLFSGAVAFQRTLGIRDFCRLGSAQELDEVQGAVALAQGVDGGKQRPALRGAVQRLEAGEADVAVAAVDVGLFIEIVQQVFAAAGGQLAVLPHLLQLAQVDFGLLGVVGHGDKRAQPVHVAVGIEQQGFAGEPVAARAPGLLVVALHVLGKVHVHDKAHVGLVDAHAERDGGDDDADVVAEEFLLVERPDILVEPRVVGQGRVPRPREVVRPGLGR